MLVFTILRQFLPFFHCLICKSTNNSRQTWSSVQRLTWVDFVFVTIFGGENIFDVFSFLGIIEQDKIKKTRKQTVFQSFKEAGEAGFEPA